MSTNLKQVLDEQVARIEGKTFVKKIIAKGDKEDNIEDDPKTEEREDKHMVSLKSSHYKKAVQMLKQLGIPEQAGELRIMIILGIAAQLARGDGLQALQAMKSIKNLLTSFLTRGQEKLNKNTQYQNFLTDHKLFASVEKVEAKVKMKASASVKDKEVAAIKKIANQIRIKTEASIAASQPKLKD